MGQTRTIRLPRRGRSVQARAACCALVVACALGLSGCVCCYLPGAQSHVSLAQSVSALASSCNPGSAGGQINNDAASPVVVQLQVAWVSVSNSTLASATAATTTVPAHGTATFSVKPNHRAVNALSCTATITSVKRG